MANPQKENGYTPIANELLEKIISSGLNGTEISVVLHIFRKTYGYQKKEDEISLSQFMKAIPVSKPTICSALNNLRLVKILKLVKKGNSLKSSNLWYFNKNYDEWQLVKKSKLVKKTKRTSKDFKTQLVKKPLHTKETIQKKDTKETSELSSQIQDPVNEIFKTFYDNGNKGINFGNKTERASAEWLIKEFGIEKSINTIKYALSLVGKQYAPIITTPYQLKNNLTKLMAYYKREKTPAKGVVPEFKF